MDSFNNIWNYQITNYPQSILSLNIQTVILQQVLQNILLMIDCKQIVIVKSTVAINYTWNCKNIF